MPEQPAARADVTAAEAEALLRLSRYGSTLLDQVLAQHRDQVLTEAADTARLAAEALPDGHRAIPGLLVAASGLLAARSAPTT